MGAHLRQCLSISPTPFNSAYPPAQRMSPRKQTAGQNKWWGHELRNWAEDEAKGKARSEDKDQVGEQTRSKARGDGEVGRRVGQQ